MSVLQSVQSCHVMLVLRALQFISLFVALALFAASFNNTTRSVVPSDPKTTESDAVDIAWTLGGPSVSFVLLVTYSGAVYCVVWLYFFLRMPVLHLTNNWTLSMDAALTVLLISGGCSIGASDYVRFCDLYKGQVNCATLRTGAAFCVGAFSLFLASLAWGAWLRRTTKRVAELRESTVSQQSSYSAYLMNDLTPLGSTPSTIPQLRLSHPSDTSQQTV